MTRFVLNMTRVILKMTPYFLNTSGFTLKITELVLYMTYDDDDESNGIRSDDWYTLWIFTEFADSVYNLSGLLYGNGCGKDVIPFCAYSFKVQLLLFLKVLDQNDRIQRDI